MGSESVVMLDKWAVDWRAFLAARINSHIEFHHQAPDRLTILHRRGCTVTPARESELEKLFRDVVSE